MKKKFVLNVLYAVFVLAACCLLIVLLKIFNFWGFLAEIENKTFDLRQQVVSKYKTHNPRIVILSVDDPSYEYIVSKYGAWPAPRDFWAYLAKGIEQAEPKAIIFDLLFVQNFKAFGNTDKKLSDVVNSNKNIYVSMNFDNQNHGVRAPIALPDALKTNVRGNTIALKKSEAINYTNVRGILPDLMTGTENIGFINILRDNDGIIRTNLPLFIYKDNFYKHLTLLAALNLLNLDTDEMYADPANIYLPDGRKIPIDNEGRCYLNWYGGSGTFEYIPVWKTDKEIAAGNTGFLNAVFKDKIVYIGTTTTSLSDVKSTPLAQKYPGVEIQTTFLNNILDNNFIKRVQPLVDTLLTLFLILLSGAVVIRSKSVSWAIFNVFLIIVLYTVLTLVLMNFFNLWVALMLPVAGVIATVTACYVIKYIVTSRDYEHTYKLAVTDGLTDMFNHRYFQEQMKASIDNSKRYNVPFSLIMVDIDFFKKFNDKYGHQSGDAVLRQVAMTIKRNIRSTDIPCRYGGEEMSVILTNTNKSEAAVVAQKICEAVREREFELANGSWTHVTISLGVATMPEDGETTQGLIEYADKCLYIAKENGRNQVISDINQLRKE